MEFDDAGVDVPLDVGELAARQVVDDADRPRPLFDEQVDQVGADERRASGDQDLLLIPIHALLLLRPPREGRNRAVRARTGKCNREERNAQNCGPSGRGRPYDRPRFCEESPQAGSLGFGRLGAAPRVSSAPGSRRDGTAGPSPGPRSARRCHARGRGRPRAGRSRTGPSHRAPSAGRPYPSGADPSSAPGLRVVQVVLRRMEDLGVELSLVLAVDVGRRGRQQLDDDVRQAPAFFPGDPALAVAGSTPPTQKTSGPRKYCLPLTTSSACW